MSEAERPSAPKPRSAFHLAVLAALLTLLGANLVRLAERATAVLRTSYSRDYGEGCVLAMVQLLAERGTYFTSLRDYPFVHGNYPPVFILLNLPLYLAFGPTLLAPRLLSLLATLGIVVTLARLLQRQTGGRLYSWAVALAFLAPWFVQTWAPLGRVDMLACLLSLAGLHVFAKAEGSQQRWLAYALFWLAFFTKQNALLAPLAVVLGLFADPRGRGRAPRVLLEFALPLLGLFGLLCLLTGGQAYLHLVPYTAAADYEWDRMARAYRDFLVLIGPFLALILAALAAEPGRALRGPTAPYAFYWILNLLALPTLAKAGAAQNYLIEPYLATLILAALLLYRLLEAPALPVSAWPAFLLVAAAVATFADIERGRARLPPQDDRELAELSAIVKATNGPILSEDLSVLVLNRKPVLVEPFGMWLISKRGLVDPAPVVTDCEARRFALVIFDFRLREIPGLDRCLGHRYESWTRLGPYELLRPRAEP